MLDFDQPLIRFKVKGEVYHLDSLNLEDAARISQLEHVDQTAQITAMKDLLQSKARAQSPAWWLWLRGKPSPLKAIRSLSAVQQARLFGEWMAEFKQSRGVVPGESSGSAN